MGGPKAEEKVRTNRLLYIDDLIRSGAYPNAVSLARKTEVTPRTIQRDIDYLRLFYNAPIAYDALRRGYYYTEENFFIKSVLLTEGELFSIALFDPLLDQYRNTPLEGDLRKIFGKIVRSLPDTINVEANFLTGQMSFIPDITAKIDLEAFKVVFTALKTKAVITFEYRPLSKDTYMKRTVDPYHAIAHKGNWYVIGHCHDRGEPRMFAFSRIKNAALTKNRFTIPEGFNPHEYFDREMGVWASSRTPQTVELLFDKEIGAYASDRQWHSTQTIEERKDGSVYVKFETSQIPEALRFVLGQGHTVKALGPPELVERVKAEAERVRGMYPE
jgi:predicted DNA-binding transcriptional regulator YafY